MEEMDRRNLFAAFTAFAAMAATPAGAQTGARTLGAQTSGAMTTAQLSKSRVIKYADIPVRSFPNGGTQRRVVSGTLPTGEFIEIHETMLPAGQMPHPPHSHPNTELLFIQSGTLEYLDAGKVIAVEANDIVFSASNISHGLKNVGTTPASYIVCSISKQLPE
jgi:quercetin dioxygenase-like cupin family protein